MKAPPATHVIRVEGSKRVPRLDNVVQVDDPGGGETWQGDLGRWRRLHDTWLFNGTVVEPHCRVTLERTTSARPYLQLLH